MNVYIFLRQILAHIGTECSLGSSGEWRRRRVEGDRQPSGESPDVGLLSRQARAPLGVCVPTSTSDALQQPLLRFGHGERAAGEKGDILGYEKTAEKRP